MATNNRVAVVTGAARGLGREVATTLALEGYDLALIDAADLEGAAHHLAAAGAGPRPGADRRRLGRVNRGQLR